MDHFDSPHSHHFLSESFFFSWLGKFLILCCKGVVWQDGKIKSSQSLHKCAQYVAATVFKDMVLTIAPKLSYIWATIVRECVYTKNVTKMVQSGHFVQEKLKSFYIEKWLLCEYKTWV